MLESVSGKDSATVQEDLRGRGLTEASGSLRDYDSLTADILFCQNNKKAKD